MKHNSKNKAEDKKEEFSLIIERPEAITGLRHGAEVSIITIGWLVWFVILRPLLLILLWYIGVRAFSRHMLYLKGWQTLEERSIIYILVVLGIYLVVRGWNVYNFRRFGKRNHRTDVRNVTEAELGRFFSLPAGSVEKIQSWNEVSVFFHKDHMISLSKQKDTAQGAVSGQFRPT